MISYDTGFMKNMFMPDICILCTISGMFAFINMGGGKSILFDLNLQLDITIDKRSLFSQNEFYRSPGMQWKSK